MGKEKGGFIRITPLNIDTLCLACPTVQVTFNPKMPPLEGLMGNFFGPFYLHSIIVLPKWGFPSFSFKLKVKL